MVFFARVKDRHEPEDEHLDLDFLRTSPPKSENPGLPIAHRRYQRDRLKLEDKDILDIEPKFAKLQREMYECATLLYRAARDEKREAKALAKKAATKDDTKKDVKGDGKEKKGKAVNEEDIEFIVQEPFIFHEFIVEGLAPAEEEVKSTTSTLAAGPDPEKTTSFSQSRSRLQSQVGPQAVSEKASQSLELGRRNTGISMNLESASSERSTEEEAKDERLILSDDPLCVASLYVPMDTNRIPIRDRLAQANRKRLMERRKRMPSLPPHLCETFKSLAIAKEHQRWKKEASRYARVKEAPKERPPDAWDSQYKEDENMEMRVATFNEMESKVRSHLLKSNDSSNVPVAEKTSATSTKKAKNKNQAKQDAKPPATADTKPKESAADDNNSSRVRHTTRSGSRIDANSSARKSPRPAYHLKTEKEKIKGNIEPATNSRSSNSGSKIVNQSQASGRDIQHRINSLQRAKTESGEAAKSLLGSSENVNVHKMEQSRIIQRHIARHLLNKNHSAIKHGQFTSNETKLPPIHEQGVVRKSSLKVTDSSCTLKQSLIPGDRKRSVSFAPQIGATSRGLHLKLVKRTVYARDQNRSQTSSPPRTHSNDKTPTRPKPSMKKLVNQPVCTCRECAFDEGLLSYLRPPLRWGSLQYPCILGRFQKYPDMQRSSGAGPADVKSRWEALMAVSEEDVITQAPNLPRSNRNVFQDAQEKLMNFMDGLVICKEIISTTSGRTFTTVTFARGDQLLPYK